MRKSISKTPKESSFSNRLQQILHNRTEGAGFIENAATDLILSIINSANPDSKELIINSIDKISDRFAAMANITNLSNFARENIGFYEIGAFELMLKDYINISKILKQITVINCGDLIEKYKTIFTLSNSSMVRESILYAISKGWNGKVLIIESRPKNEGAILASKLAEHNINVELAVDALMPKLIAQSDAVFLGADTITPSFFVNKIGSQSAIDYAVKLGKPCYRSR